MNTRNNIIKVAMLTVALLATACHDLLDEPPQNRKFTEETDYTDPNNMFLTLVGAYAEFQNRGWEEFPIIAVRGDDVNAGGLGDQQDFAETDKYNYNKAFWMYNSAFSNIYKDILAMHSTIEQIELYKENGADQTLADQYIAEAKVLRAYLLFNISRVWGDVLIPSTSEPLDFFDIPLSAKADVMQHISDQMTEAIPNLPNVHPNARTDIRGGVTQYTALAIKALANLELKNYQEVADATSQIIESGEFSLYPEFYDLFKTPGKLSDESILELQYSDFGQSTGTAISYLFEFFGPPDWTPARAGSGTGWGFYEPSLKWIKFMLDRNEETRLQTSVLFTNRGIEALQSDPDYADLPDWISNTTPSGDVINNHTRAMFLSGKHYLPSNELTPGRTAYGTNKNMAIIRYAEILLMYAEALTMGASGSGLTATEAVNQVRTRAGLGELADVTHEQVMDEKFAELAMEWGVRYFDMVRLGKYDELSYEGRTFNESLIYLPYPQDQVDLLPALDR